jgi:menaquinone-9 beta-reductase
MSRASGICVIGGGPAGLAASIALAQEGFEITVVDCAKPPIDKACGEGLMPDSIRALRSLGVELPRNVGFAFQGVRFTDGVSSVAADFPGESGMGVRRTVLHGLLVERARRAGVELVWGAKGLALPEASFVIGADGQNSSMRRHAGLNRTRRESRRYGFRRHYRIEPWSRYVELHWGVRRQVYITPVAGDEVCVALISRDPQLRLDRAVAGFPELEARLRNATPVTAERGALSVSRTLRRVHGGNLALIGDASGSVDAITGEGIGVAFRQALALAESLKSGDVESYARAHEAILRRPRRMGALMLALERHPELQRRVLAALERRPEVFASLLAFHVGERWVARGKRPHFLLLQETNTFLLNLMNLR